MSSRVEAVASYEFGTCSILASDLNRIAYEVIDPKQTETRTFFFLGDDEQDCPQASNAVALHAAYKLPSGRESQLMLMQSKNVMGGIARLCAVTRGDVALPIMSFGRRQTSSGCDFVQIGEEMKDESVVATRDDITRKDILEATKSLLMFNVLGRHPQLLKDIKAKEITSGEVLRSLPRLKGSLIRDRIQDLARRNNVTTAKAFLGVVGIDKSSDTDNSKKYQRARSEFVEFFENPSFKSIFERKAPGSQINILRVALASELCKRLSVNLTEVNHYAPGKFLDLLDVEKMFSTFLGPTTPESESVIKYVGKVAKARKALRMTDATTVDGTSTNMDFLVSATQRGATYSLSLGIRPVTQPGIGHKPVYDELEIDRLGRLSIDPEDVAELKTRLGRFVTVHGLAAL